MAFVIPDASERECLARILANNTAPANCVLRLYTNNYTPVESSILTDFTEPTDSAYGAIPLIGNLWVISTVTGVSTAQYPDQVFNFSALASVYGYFITSTDSLANDVVLIAERFTTAPFNIPAGGGTVTIRPLMQLE